MSQYVVDLPDAPITIIDDSLKESPETFKVQIFKASGAVITKDTGTVTITDNDTNGVVGFSIDGQAQAPEGNSAGSSQVTFTVNLTAAATTDVTFMATPRELVGFGSQGAKAGIDFVATPVPVTIQAGETSGTFSIPILGNTTFQDDRSFAVDVSQLSSNAQAQNSTAIGTILDDDTSFVHNVLKWHDVDGDVVTLKVSKGNLANAGFNFSSPNTDFGGITLQQFDISGGKHQFAHANVTITAESVKLLATSQVIGDGHVNVGAIIANEQPLKPLQTANAVDLGVVTVDGDLARIDAGDFFSDTALTRLNVVSFGAHPETLPTGQTPVSTIVGPLGGVHIATDFGGVANNAPTLQVIGEQFGTISGLHIGGSLMGTVLFTSRLTTAVIGKIDGSAAGHGAIEAFTANATIGSLKVLGSITGGSADDSGAVEVGHIGKVDVGSVIGGTGQRSGMIIAQNGVGTASIGSVNVHGSIVGSSSTAADSNSLSNGAIVSFGALGSVHLGGDLVGGAGSFSGSVADFGGGGIASIFVDGNVFGGSGNQSGVVGSNAGIGLARILGSVKGGTGNSSGGITATGTIGSVEIDGNLQGGDSLAASTTATATAETGFISAAVIGTARIGGNIAAGTDQGAGLSRSGVINALGTIRSLTVRGSLLGTTGNFTPTDALISAGGKVSGLAIGHVEIDGDIKGADIIAGISTSVSGGTFFIADAQIGTVVIKSSKVDGFHIAAGADVGTDGKFGATDADPTKTDDVVLATLTNVRSVLDQAKGALEHRQRRLHPGHRHQPRRCHHRGSAGQIRERRESSAREASRAIYRQHHRRYRQ